MAGKAKAFKVIRALLLALLIVGAIIGAIWYHKGQGWLSHGEIAGPAKLRTTADKLKHTIVTPHLEQKIVKGKNVLWCATAQIAWNELCNLAGEDIHLENEPDMVAILNKKSVTHHDLDEASYVAAAGMAEDGIIEQIDISYVPSTPQIKDFPADFSAPWLVK